MNIGNAIYNILSNDATITGIVGTSIFPLAAPDGTDLPYITYFKISHNPNKNKSREKTIETLRIQIDNFAVSNTAASALADAVNSALSYYTGTVESINIDIITFEDENDLHEVDSKVYRKEQDYLIRVKN